MCETFFDSTIKFIRQQYDGSDLIPLHSPVFSGREREFVNDTIDSTFVSSVGKYVDRFESDLAAYTGSPKAICTVNGTAALHVSLKLAGLQAGELVITQPLTFIATCNAISYCGAEPIFIDVDKLTLSLSPCAIDEWLENNAYISDDGYCRDNIDNKVIRVCMPMHTFGIPCDLDGLLEVCERWALVLVEDAAESLGSLYKSRHTGTFGLLGAVSFNGNKIITAGGGGVILTNEALASRAKHITTTAKIPHPYEYVHDEIGYNFRLPNLNAALGCAQLEQIEIFVEKKRELASRYANFFSGSGLQFIFEPKFCRSNYWLNAVICRDRTERTEFLKKTNSNGIMTRPIWELMSQLTMFRNCRRGPLNNAEWLEARVLNLPSGVNI